MSNPPLESPALTAIKAHGGIRNPMRRTTWDRRNVIRLAIVSGMRWNTEGRDTFS